MKALVTFYTETGNTEKIAAAAHAELENAGEATIKKVEDTTPDELTEYDVVFVSSPIHGGGLAPPADEFLGSLPEGATFKLAGLITHLSEIYQTDSFQRGLDAFVETAREKEIEYLGYYDCQGKLAPAIRPIVQKARGMSDEEFQKYMDDLDQHPNDEDVEGATEFVKEVLGKL